MNKLCLNTGSPPGSWPGGERKSKGAVRGMAVQAVPRQSGLCEDAAARGLCAVFQSLPEQLSKYFLRAGFAKAVSFLHW